MLIEQAVVEKEEVGAKRDGRRKSRNRQRHRPRKCCRWFRKVKNGSGAEVGEVGKLLRMVHTIDEQKDAAETCPGMSWPSRRLPRSEELVGIRLVFILCVLANQGQGPGSVPVGRIEAAVVARRKLKAVYVHWSVVCGAGRRGENKGW